MSLYMYSNITLALTAANILSSATGKDFIAYVDEEGTGVATHETEDGHNITLWIEGNAAYWADNSIGYGSDILLNSEAIRHIVKHVNKEN